MEDAMGQKPSWVPWATAVLVFLGILTAQGMMNYIMVYDWPMNFGGKPFFAWPSFVPITFELMVLFAAIGSAVVAIIGGKRDTVPQPPPMLIQTGATIDRFVLWISATDPEFDEQQTLAFVESIGAQEVRVVEAPSGTAPSGTAPSGTAPSGTAPSGTAPSGRARVGDETKEGDEAKGGDDE